MLWSFVGLLAATVSELIVRVPGLVQDWIGFCLAIGIASSVTVAVGALATQRAVARIR